VATFALLAAATLSLSGGQPISTFQPSDPLFCGRVIAVECTDRNGDATLILEARPGDALAVSVSAQARTDVISRLGNNFRQHNVCVARRTAPGLVPNAHPAVRRADEITVTSNPAPEPGGEVFTTCDPEVRAPTPVRLVRPQYPVDAVRAHAAGTVVLAGVVDATGHVGDIRVAYSVEESLDEVAREAFAQWRFRPGLRKGTPVAVSVTADLTFTIASGNSVREQ